MRTAVYPGSFDPLHIGHKSIIEHLCRMERFDCVRLIVSPQSPFKDAGKACNAEERFEAAMESVRKLKASDGLYDRKIVVDDIELKMPAPHYTLRTLAALREMHPDSSFTLAIGADQLADFRKWDHYDRILLEFGIIVFPRRGFDSAALASALKKENPAYVIDLADAPIVTISSTEIRSAEALGEDMSHVRF